MTRITAVAFLVACIVAIAAAAFAEGNEVKLEGSKPYMPTRLEWLAVELNATHSTELTQVPGYSLHFVADHPRDTILIYARYIRSADPEIVNSAVAGARELVKITAEGYRWDNWLKVREHIKSH